MNERAGEDGDSRKPTALYHDYLTVIYGLLATEGLIQFSRLLLAHGLSLSSFLLFLGTFLTSLHFWFACVTVDGVSQPFYTVLTSRNERLRSAFLLIDAVFAAAFAACLLIMFASLSPESGQPLLVFSGFLWLGVISLVYDLYSWGLVATVRKFDLNSNDREAVAYYGTVVRRWVIQDLTFCILAGIVRSGGHRFPVYLNPFAAGLVAVSVTVLIFDVFVLDDDSSRRSVTSSLRH